jgi:hypothetical protein
MWKLLACKQNTWIKKKLCAMTGCCNAPFYFCALYSEPKQEKTLHSKLYRY